MKNYLYITIFLLTACASTPHQETRSGIPRAASAPPPQFIEDDYALALARAKAENVPLFVDSWASWCHSCVSLKNFVFTDARVAKETSHFVWLSIDTENTKNADFLAKFPNAAIPTLRVIDPDTQTARWTWEGTLTAPELVDTLDELRGAQKTAQGQARDQDAAVMRLYDEKKFDECASQATATIGKLSGTQRVDVAVTGVECTLELPKDAQQKYLPALVKELRAIVNDASLLILADDRSSAYEALVDAGEAAGEKTAVHENAAAWAKFLEGEAARATTPAERAVFDPHRLLAYLALGEPARAVPMLAQSEKDFPQDFNPPARLARAYTELGKYDDAIAASDRALALANGPRRVRIELGKADAQEKKGDAAGEKKTLEDTLAFIGTLPAAQSSSKLKAAVQDRLKKLGAKTP